MTRKCVLCKETNYKNTYSFFSAPKDPETRKKWQDAIAIENYSVTDETYVCSKHFHKEDIITHWVSGVPPHVITIKYKKCRLRPGAVPEKHLEENNRNISEYSDDSDINMSDYLTFRSENEDGFHIEKNALAISKNEDALYKMHTENTNSMDTEYCFSSQFEDPKFMGKDRTYSASRTHYIEGTGNYKSKMKVEKPETSENSSQDSYATTCVRRGNKYFINAQKYDKPEKSKKNKSSVNTKSQPNIPQKNSESPRIFGRSDAEDTSTDMWEQKKRGDSKYFQERTKSHVTVDNLFEDVKTESQFLNSEDFDSLDTQYYSLYNNSEDGEMLFEDLLEVCNEILLPRGWSCLVTSKGHSTTIVYLYMSMTKSGMPFAEKQIFLKSDMILRCVAVNIEINPLIHNLIRDGKHLKVQNLMDIEALVEEFDQRVVCQGIYFEGLQKINGIKAAYKDGVRWRHVLCPILLNNDSTRCTKCITLSHMLARKSNALRSRQYSLPMLLKKQKAYALSQIRKRTRKHDRRYFIKFEK